jgi:hypothetical protein
MVAGAATWRGGGEALPSYRVRARPASGAASSSAAPTQVGHVRAIDQRNPVRLGAQPREVVRNVAHHGSLRLLSKNLVIAGVGGCLKDGQSSQGLCGAEERSGVECGAESGCEMAIGVDDVATDHGGGDRAVVAVDHARQAGAIGIWRFGVAEQKNRNLPMLATLKAYLDHGCRAAPAARTLGVHINTLYQRIAVLDRLLGPDWRQPPRSLDLHVLLRVFPNPDPGPTGRDA